jgi:hypothetical protein
MPIPKWTIKGIVDDYDTCGCCGRRGLKRTVALMPLDADGTRTGTAEDVVYYGTSCTAIALSWTQGKVTDTARAAQAERDQRDAYARRMISIYAPVDRLRPDRRGLPAGKRARGRRRAARAVREDPGQRPRRPGALPTRLTAVHPTGHRNSGCPGPAFSHRSRRA